MFHRISSLFTQIFATLTFDEMINSIMIQVFVNNVMTLVRLVMTVHPALVDLAICSSIALQGYEAFETKVSTMTSHMNNEELEMESELDIVNTNLLASNVHQMRC